MAKNDSLIVGIRMAETHTNILPRFFSLCQNYPNPFKIRTIIKYGIPKKCHISINVYDSMGRLVRTLIDETKEPGYYKIFWDGKDNRGQRLPCGIYFYRMENEVYVSPLKIVIVH